MACKDCNGKGARPVMQNYRNWRLGVCSVVLAYLTLYWLSPEPSPIISTKLGQLQGFRSTSRSGRSFYEFRGIPFAEPPVGGLRFESPVPKKPWQGVLNARTHGASCIHYDFIISGRYIGEESCLFLNVMTAQMEIGNISPRRLVPVIVFFHGGAFNVGEGRMHGGRLFMDEDIVLVVPNYRLGMFGFLNTDDDVVKGNMGLKDQVQALRWVQENIEHFGGDPAQVTIMGESAGGGSVHFHMMSPMSTGLFQRAISLSCFGISDLWQLERDNREHVDYVAKDIGCPINTTREFVKCLRDMSAEELVEKYHARHDSPVMFHDYHTFGPSLENHDEPDKFLHVHTVKLMKEGRIPNSVPWMAGVNSDEGSALSARAKNLPGFENFLIDEETFTKYINHILWFNKTEAPYAPRLIQEQFFGNLSTKVVTDDAVQWAISKMVTEKIFILPLVESVKYQSRLSPTYVYVNNHKTLLSLYHIISWGWDLTRLRLPFELSIGLNTAMHALKTILFGQPFPDFGVSHADELMYLFDLNIAGFYYAKYYDAEISRLFIKALTNFANASNPIEFNGLNWPAVNNSEPLQVMNIGLGPPKISVDPFEQRLKFWRKLNIPWT